MSRFLTQFTKTELLWVWRHELGNSGTQPLTTLIILIAQHAILLHFDFDILVAIVPFPLNWTFSLSFWRDGWIAHRALVACLGSFTREWNIPFRARKFVEVPEGGINGLLFWETISRRDHSLFPFHFPPSWTLNRGNCRTFYSLGCK